MKKIVWLFMSVMALSLAISCDKDNSNDSDIIGTWLKVSESFDDESGDDDTKYLQFRKDGTLIIVWDYDEIDSDYYITWSMEGKVLTITLMSVDFGTQTGSTNVDITKDTLIFMGKGFQITYKRVPDSTINKYL